MVEIILGPLVELILVKLVTLVSDQVRLLRNLKPEILNLKVTVTITQGVLLDAEKKQSHDNQVKLWLEKISDVMYDAEDLLDDLSTEVALRKLAKTHRRPGMAATFRRRIWSPVSSRSKQLMYNRKMARDIKALREKLDVISREKEAFKFEVGTELRALPSFRETDACPPSIMIGRDEDKKNIIELLLNYNPEANISVVSIVGMGGLGKSTLAKSVFDDKEVQDHFGIKAWVYVSQSFDFKMIIRRMLESITREKVEDLTLDALQARLRGEIEGKKFLFVLDDAWEEKRQSWEKLENYLAVGALGSKVLLTTRSTRVADFAGGALKSRTITSIVEPYKLEGLSEEESWNLLVEKAFPRKLPQEPQLQEIGKEILRKCGGVPLAVSTIAGVLVDSNDPKTEWPSFKEKSVSSITKEGEKEDPTMSALKLSFNHLPSHMKHCFSYCKLFGKGERLRIKLLVQLWVAQGYIDSEDKGFDCFKTLWWRSFFQEVEMDGQEWLDNMSTCTMHDLMHDLAGSIAGEKIIVTPSLTILKNIPSKTRHLCIRGDRDQREEDHGGDGLGNASQVRTLMCRKTLTREEVQQVIKNFIRLRVLIFVCKDPDSDDEDRSILDAFTSINFDKLKHLRFLAFNCEGRKGLPNSISNLVNLQVLELSASKSLEELPKDIEKLVNLKHLELKAEFAGQLTHMPKGIGKLKFLARLPMFVVRERSSSIGNDETVGAELDELKGLNALCGELIIRGLGHPESPRTGVYVLNEKQHLQSLVIDWGRYYHFGADYITSVSIHHEGILEILKPHFNLKKLAIHAGYEGVKIPNWLSGLTNLVEFSLEDCRQCEYLPPQIHKMQSLKKLTIDNCPLLKGIDDDGHHRDSSPIEEEDCEWPRFRCLANLRIEHCPRLTRLPTFPTVEGELELVAVSLAPLARTMKMKMRGEGGVGYRDYFDTNIHPLGTSSSSALVHSLSGLTKLTLKMIDDDFESLSYHDSSSCLVSLQELRIGECHRGVKLPSSLCSSASLTLIDLRGCEKVEYLPPLHGLPSLKELTIWDCPNLKGCWWKKRKGNNDNYGDGGDDDYYNFDPSMEEEREDEEWPRFPCLLALDIGGCPNLTRIPLFPTVEGLRLMRTSSEALVRTMKMQVAGAVHHDSQQHSTTTATTSPSSQRTALDRPLSNLKKLKLWLIEELEFLPEEGLCNLTSLRELDIYYCPRLANLLPAIQHFTSLHILKICGCPELIIRCEKGGGEDWPNISHIPNINLDGYILQASGWVP
ncbi:unnamed protein product [Linum trigynum]|uniref:Uncharacterized protein n=1 Tax=Linum trigynum TaxID=586398 RepID=A0AAV2GEP3_9ROSI